MPPRAQRKTDLDEGTFDPEDASKVRHTKIGVWDLYEEIEPDFKLKLIPESLRQRLQSYREMKDSFPYVTRMFKEISSIESCFPLFVGYLACTLFAALIPAVELWYSGRLLKIVQTAVEHRTVDRNNLLQIVAGRFVCGVVKHFVDHTHNQLYRPLNERIRQHFAVQNFRARARLDVPTYADSSVLRQLDTSSTNSFSSTAWNNVLILLRLSSNGVQLVSQLSVLMNMLRDQRDGPLLGILSFSEVLLRRLVQSGYTFPGVWAATTRDPDYLRSSGMARVIQDQSHRKELVAGGLAEYVIASYREATQRLGNKAVDFYNARYLHTVSNRIDWSELIFDRLSELPQIVFTLRAVQYPADLPLSLASLTLITTTTSAFSQSLFNFFDQTGSIAENLAAIRKMYETYEIPNAVKDGQKPFPENTRDLDLGMSVEFRNVSFRYPGSNQDVLRNVSFKIHQGQLCVIVGANGSGKSTILKLISRLYDPTEGHIFINGQDIKTLKLADLRRATTVLFQDYTHFPLSIRDNIALGDPAAASDEAKIREAARLGGAADFIERFDEGYDTYLERPVDDYYSALPQGTKRLFGREVEYRSIRWAGKMSTHAKGLSGGQMQRIALSRTFMRDEGVGLLCFDEPSASLDPTAEHDLFERLRLLRGNKTMIFSSHRFGNLTRHADLILYMDDAAILEEGTHDELIKMGGGYAKIWMLQAQAFLS